MAGLNKVLMIGRLATDPEMSYAAGGTAMTLLDIAVKRFTRVGGEGTEISEVFRVVTWDRLAQVCEEHLSRGREVYVEGRLQLRTAEGANGEPVAAADIVASKVEFLGPADNQTRRQPMLGDDGGSHGPGRFLTDPSGTGTGRDQRSDRTDNLPGRTGAA